MNKICRQVWINIHISSVFLYSILWISKIFLNCEEKSIIFKEIRVYIFLKFTYTIFARIEIFAETCPVQRALDLPTLMLLVERERRALNNCARVRACNFTHVWPWRISYLRLFNFFLMQSHRILRKSLTNKINKLTVKYVLSLKTAKIIQQKIQAKQIESNKAKRVK